MYLGSNIFNGTVVLGKIIKFERGKMETVIGRLGKNSKMVICGDMAQIDLRDKRDTGFSFLSRLEEQVEGFKVHQLERNHRHEIVTPILEVYKTFRD